MKVGADIASVDGGVVEAERIPDEVGGVDRIPRHRDAPAVRTAGICLPGRFRRWRRRRAGELRLRRRVAPPACVPSMYPPSVIHARPYRERYARVSCLIGIVDRGGAPP